MNEKLEFKCLIFKTLVRLNDFTSIHQFNFSQFGLVIEQLNITKKKFLIKKNYSCT